MKRQTSGPRFNIKMLSYQYRKSHCGDKTVVRSSYLHNGISFTGKMSSLYWIRALGTWLLLCQNIRVPAKLQQGRRQHVSRRFLSGDEEGHKVIDGEFHGIFIIFLGLWKKQIYWLGPNCHFTFFKHHCGQVRGYVPQCAIARVFLDLIQSTCQR